MKAIVSQRRFSLRILFLLLTVLAVILAIVGNRLNKQRRNARLVAHAASMAEADGCSVLVFGPDKKGRYAIDIYGKAFSIPTAQALVGATAITQLSTNAVRTDETRGALAQRFLYQLNAAPDTEWTYWVSGDRPTGLSVDEPSYQSPSKP